MKTTSETAINRKVPSHQFEIQIEECLSGGLERETVLVDQIEDCK